MKKITFIINCLLNKIKNKFFNSSRTDISHDCEKVFNLVENVSLLEELKCDEEYLDNYKVTTRWQTL